MFVTKICTPISSSFKKALRYKTRDVEVPGSKYKDNNSRRQVFLIVTKLKVMGCILQPQYHFYCKMFGSEL